MTSRTLPLFALLAGLLIGCSSDPGQKNQSVAVNGTVAFADGKPVKDVTLNLFPTSAGQLPASAPLKADGKFSLQLIPGKYTFGFEGKGPALKAVPASYLDNNEAHTVEVPAAGGDLAIRVGAD